MKKLMSIFLAAVSALTMSTAVMAEETTTGTKAPEPATLTFDTDKCMSYIHTFGNASDSNLTYTLSDSGAVEGRCLKLDESFTGTISNQYGGIYFDAADFGLESFAGYTMTVSVKTNASTAKATPYLVAFSDGDQWVSNNFDTTINTGKWASANVSVPADKNNTKIGISIPITSDFSGEVCVIDNMKLTDNYGKAIANVGDRDTSLSKAPNGFVSVITTILFVLLILAIIGAVALIVKKFFWRFR